MYWGFQTLLTIIQASRAMAVASATARPWCDGSVRQTCQAPKAIATRTARSERLLMAWWVTAGFPSTLPNSPQIESFCGRRLLNRMNQRVFAGAGATNGAITTAVTTAKGISQRARALAGAGASGARREGASAGGVPWESPVSSLAWRDFHHRLPRAATAIGATTTGKSLKQVPTAVAPPLSR